MAARSGDTIWELVAQAAATLPEPFSRQALITWIAERRPDVELSSISAHIHVAIAETPHRETHALGHRPPLLHRVDRGLYRRYRGPGDAFPRERVPAGTSSPPPSPGAPVSGTGVVLVGCSSRKAPSAAPARDLFLGPGFQRGRDYAISSHLPWFVLSAKFGLLEPDTVVSPYDVYLGDQPAEYRRAWGEWVVARLSQSVALRGTSVEVHAGEAYVHPLREPLARVGALLVTPLAGLRQGERLAWPGYRAHAAEDDEPGGPANAAPSIPDLSSLLDDRNAVRPSVFLSQGRGAADRPGLYTWWVDVPGSHALSAGLGHRIPPGLIYAGRAGGQRADGRNSGNTLWGRVAGMHLQGNRDFSTFRLTLTAALLRSDADVADEPSLTAWMHDHLGVNVLPLPADAVFPAERELLRLADPPLNLSGMPASPLRRALSQLRSEIGRRG